MRKLYLILAVVLAIAVFSARGIKPVAAQGPAHEIGPLELVQRIPVPNVSGCIDHFTAFPKRRLVNSLRTIRNMVVTATTMSNGIQVCV